MGMGLLVVVSGVPAASTARPTGVFAPARAQNNWMLHCQGCHLASGDTQTRNAPPLAGQVSRVLAVAGGREYLARVPGVATTPLPDDQLAELLNWTLARFDPQHLPPDYRPYTAQEIHRLRQLPLRTEAGSVRASLQAKLSGRNKHQQK